MELFLNLVWASLAALLVCLWLRFTPPIGPNRRMQDRRLQFVALAVLILILFPVISVTDDLQAAQNPAEADSCLRRDHGYSSQHSILPAVAALPLPAFAGLCFAFRSLATPDGLSAPVVANPALAPVQNRPPPVA